MLGNGTSDSLNALKRVKIAHRARTHSLSFCAPDIPGDYLLCMCLVSDSYLGIEQQYGVWVVVTDSKSVDEVSKLEESIIIN